MPAGVQVFEGSGNTVLDYNDATGKYVGEASLPATTGSPATGTITDARFALGSFWWLTTLPPTTEYSQDVTVTLSGTTLTWTVGESCPACTLYYGVI